MGSRECGAATLAALGLGGRHGDSRTYCLRSWRGRPRTSPVLSGATQVIMAGIPVAAACWSGPGIPAGRNQKGPLHV